MVTENKPNIIADKHLRELQDFGLLLYKTNKRKFLYLLRKKYPDLHTQFLSNSVKHFPSALIEVGSIIQQTIHKL